MKFYIPLHKQISVVLLLIALWPVSAHAKNYTAATIEGYQINNKQPGDSAQQTNIALKLENISEIFYLSLNHSDLIDAMSMKGSKDQAMISAFEGVVTGVENSWVRLLISGDFIHGIIDDGEQRLEVSSSDNTTIRTNLYGRDRTAKSIQIFPTNTLVSGKQFSRVIRIGLVVDELYDSQYNNRGIARAISIVNGVDGIFRQELGIAVKLDVAILTEGQSFTLQPGASPSQLSSFVQFRNQTPELQGDIALVHLFSGSALPNTPWAGIGYAYIGTTCSPVGNDVGISTPYYLGVELAAHEIAHNLGAYHDQDTASCSADTSRLMDLAIDGATSLSSCSKDLVNADLARTACFEEVHDAQITLRRSGSNNIIFGVTSSSSFTTFISPEITIAHETQARNLPPFCRNNSTDTIICTPPFFAPNQPYQFSISFDNSVSNEVNAEISEAATFDSNRTNNMAKIVIPANPATVANSRCVDSDGDGFGWNGTSSCIPVEQVAPLEQMPTIVNRGTGVPVYLSNEKWATSDLANRTIECQPYYYSSGQNQYLREETSYTRYLHTTNSGNSTGGTVSIARYVRGSNQQFVATSVQTGDWSLQDGFYSGPAPFSRSQWVQIVGAGGNQNNAIRSYSNDTSFDLCTAFPSSAGNFTPSGDSGADVCVDTPPVNDGWGWDGVQSCRIPLADVLPTQSGQTLVSPAVVIKTSNTPVLDGQVQSQEWSQATKFSVSRQALSLPVGISGIRSERGVDSWNIGHDSQYLFINAIIPDRTPFKDSGIYQNDDSLEIFIDGGNQRSATYDNDDSHFILRDTGEIAGNFRPGISITHVRRYDNTAQVYRYEIQIRKDFLQLNHGEFGFDMQVNNDQNGGERDAKWGWSGATGRNTHWYTMRNIGYACLDTDPLSARCSNTNNASSNQASCVDTGVLGDGWGWNGSTSCRVGLSTCVDTGVLNDGWGWDGTKSCRVPIN